MPLQIFLRQGCLKMDYTEFKQEIYKTTGIDLNLYKETQMLWRINSLLKRKGYDEYSGFLNEIKINN